MRSRLTGSLLALGAVSVLAAGCGSAAEVSVPSSSLTYAEGTIGANGEPVEAMPGAGSLGPGFVTPSALPAPEGTMTPSPGSWDDASPPSGFTVTLLATDESPQALVLHQAVTEWADEEGIALTTVPADDPGAYVSLIHDSMEAEPDLIVSAGDSLVDALALVTSGRLDQRFLVLGAELAEPTYNVTAADWAGASYRGEGLGTSSTYDPASFTPERAGRALRAGIAAVVTGYTGYVVWVD